METYDVVILGGGSAGETVATLAARGGKSVAVVEQRLLGGECPYFACMPSKAMLHSAEIRHRIGVAHALGAVSRPLELDEGRLAYRAAAARRHAVADRLDDSARARELQALGVTVFRGLEPPVRWDNRPGTDPGYPRITDVLGATSPTTILDALDIPPSALGYHGA